MTAVILAAGRGGRLIGVAGERPKCLARVGNCTLIERQIGALRECGIGDIVVVVGYRAADVERVCGAGIEFVLNADYATTNSLYSLWLARERIANGFVVLNCDVLFHPQLLTDLLTARYEDALLLSPLQEGQQYGEEEMKVQVRCGRVVAIDKRLPASETDGENIGIAKFGREGAAVLVEEMDRLVEAGSVREWVPRAFALCAARRPLHAIGDRGYPWIEIDYPDDYWRACGEVLPAIEAIDARRDGPAALPNAASAGSGRTRHHV
jgi:choline kinase